MLRLHQHRAQTSHGAAFALCRKMAPESYRQLRYRQMEMLTGRIIKNPPRLRRYFRQRFDLRDETENTERGLERGVESPSVVQRPPELQRRFSSLLQCFGKFSAPLQRQQLLRRPQRSRRCAWPRTLEADLPQVQLSRTEIR